MLGLKFPKRSKIRGPVEGPKTGWVLEKFWVAYHAVFVVYNQARLKCGIQKLTKIVLLLKSKKRCSNWAIYLSDLTWELNHSMEIEDRIYTGLKQFYYGLYNIYPVWKLKTGFIRDWNSCYQIHLSTTSLMEIEDRIYTGLKHIFRYYSETHYCMEIEDRIYTGLKQHRSVPFIDFWVDGNWRPDLYGIETPIYTLPLNILFGEDGNWRPDLYGIETSWLSVCQMFRRQMRIEDSLLSQRKIGTSANSWQA